MKSFVLRAVRRVVRDLRGLAEVPLAVALRSARRVAQYLAPVSCSPGTLAVVRLDAIGDYVLFRTTLQTLRSSGFATYKITVVGNQAWLAFAQALDGAIVDEWIGVDVTLHSRSPLYRAQWAWRYKSRGFELLVHPTYSPTRWADRLVVDLKATQKVAARGNSVNRGRSRGRSGLYDRLIPQDPAVLFEAYRNQEFVERWLELPVQRSLPRIDPTLLEPIEGLPAGEFVAFHLDASRPEKEWPLEQYQALIRWVMEKIGLSVVLLGAGTGGDWSGVDPARFVDGRGKTSLASVASTLSRARAFVGNDSALLHIAFAVGVRAVVALCFGQHYGRFVPYPMGSVRCDFVFPPSIESHDQDPDQLRRRYDDGSFEDIRQISLDRVVRALQGVLDLPSPRHP